MKKTVCTLLALALAGAAFTSCSKIGGKADADTTKSAGGSGRDTSAVQTSAQTEEPKDKTARLTFAAAGDNLIHESIYVEAQSKAAALASSDGYTGKYYFDSVYSDALRSLISGADISFVNQESPITGLAASGYPNFNTPTEAGDALVSMGFDIVNLANNHMLDMEYTTVGLQKAIDYWKTKDVVQIGGYESREDLETVRYIERDGVKIALLSFTYGTNGYSVNSQSSCVVPLIDDSLITSQIAKAKPNADLVFVSMHWGEENTQTPTAEQKRLAKLIADAGADAVIGHHSHTVQPIEWVTGAGGNRTLVIYSLGNFVSTMLKPVNMVGLVVTFDIVKEENMPAYIDNVQAVPTVTHYVADAAVLDSQELPTRSGICVYLMKDYTDAQAKAHGAQLQLPFTLSTLYGYVTGAVNDEFLPDFLK